MSDTPETDAVAMIEGNWDTKALRMGHHARRLERERDAARAVATGLLPHIWNGLCPDASTGPDARDPDCPACRALDDEGLMGLRIGDDPTDDIEDYSHPDWRNHYAVPLVRCRHGRDPRRCDDCDEAGDRAHDEARDEGTD